MRRTGFSTHPKEHFLISTNFLRILIFTVCVQLTRNLVLSSVNSTIKVSQRSQNEDLDKPVNGLQSEVSIRRNLPRCGGIYTVGPEDTAFRIYSPDYPLPYPALLNCIYDIKFKGGSFPCYLDLRFEDFYLGSEPPDCYGDRLEIDGQRFCGGLSGVQRFETEWNSNGERHLLLRLVSDEVGTGRGFRICVSQVPCYGPLPVPPTYPPSPPEFQPPTFQPPAILPPPSSLPSYPSYLPPLIPPRPSLPSYPPPIFPPWVPNLPLCCGSQYQGHHIHLISPGFPTQLPGGTQCGYVINRLNPRVTQLRVHFKYFFLPCPWEPLLSEGGSPYSTYARGYLNIDNRNICGCQTGLIITIPFGIFETRKVFRLSNPAINPLSRSREGTGLTSGIYNESSLSSTRKSHLQIKISPRDHLANEKSESIHLNNKNGHGAVGSLRFKSSPEFDTSQLVLFPSTSHISDGVVSTDTQRLSEKTLTKEEENSTYSTLSKSGRTFDSPLYNRPSFGPPLGFLLEVIQEEIPYYSGWRRNTFGRDGNTASNLVKVKTHPSPNSQNAASRFFHLPNRSCHVRDWPQVKWWLIWLQKKHLLQVCPARVPALPQPPFNPPSFCVEPFIPIAR